MVELLISSNISRYTEFKSVTRVLTQVSVNFYLGIASRCIFVFSHKLFYSGKLRSHSKSAKAIVKPLTMVMLVFGSVT